MKYTMDRSGIRAIMQGKMPGLNHAVDRIARQRLAMMRARAPRSTPGSGGRTPGTLAASGRVDFLGVRPVFKGEPRVTWAATFTAPHAAITQRRTGFMNVGLGKATPEPPDLPGGGR